MNYSVVTTMNAQGWEQTGRRMARSFRERWPNEAQPLAIYAEDFEPDIEGVEVRQLPPWLAEFKRTWGKVAGANGRRNNRYDYRFDAVKFAHKVAALTDFAEPIVDGVVIWLDADTYTHARVDTEWLESLFPEPAYIAWLDRLNAHPECGFVMYRASHPYHPNFMQAFRNLYTSGELYKLSETNDCTALAHVVLAKVLNGKIPAPISLSGDRTWHHPFVNGRLGERLDHLKGERKKEGKSRKRDLRRPRRESYWRG